MVGVLGAWSVDGVGGRRDTVRVGWRLLSMSSLQLSDSERTSEIVRAESRMETSVAAARERGLEGGDQGLCGLVGGVVLAMMVTVVGGLSDDLREEVRSLVLPLILLPLLFTFPPSLAPFPLAFTFTRLFQGLAQLVHEGFDARGGVTFG